MMIDIFGLFTDRGSSDAVERAADERADDELFAAEFADAEPEEIFPGVDSVGYNTERITNMTLKRISEAKKKKLRKPVRVALIAAAIAALCAGTVTAAAVMKIRVNTDVSSSDVSGSDEHIAAEISLPAFDGESVLVGFRMGYQPELSGSDVMETSETLDETAENTMRFIVLGEKYGTTDFDELVEYETMDFEEAQQAYFAEHNIVIPTEEQIYESERAISQRYAEREAELLKGYGIDMEAAKEIYTYMFRSREDRSWGVQIFSGEKIERTYFLDGASEVVKEATINGRSAVYIASTDTFSGLPMNVIAMLDEELGATVAVHGVMSFEELEQVAAGLELVPTTIPALTHGSGFGGIFTSNAQG